MSGSPLSQPANVIGGHGVSTLVVFAAAPGFDFLLFPVLSGSVLLVIVATLYHRLSGTPYPLRSA